MATGRPLGVVLELEEAIRRLDRVLFPMTGVILICRRAMMQEKQIAFETTYWRLRSGDEATLLAVIADLGAQDRSSTAAP